MPITMKSISSFPPLIRFARSVRMRHDCGPCVLRHAPHRDGQDARSSHVGAHAPPTGLLRVVRQDTEGGRSVRF